MGPHASSREQTVGSRLVTSEVKFAPLRKWVRHCILDLIDRGNLGLRPLETHVVICGFPRSGSTLLLLMAEACFARAKTFHRERSALSAARTVWRNHSLMITKNPNDI